jgi:hypothetical protein
MFVSQVAKLAIFPVIPAQFILEVEGVTSTPSDLYGKYFSTKCRSELCSEILAL